MSPFKGLPPVTGYYWIINRPPDEPFELARVIIDPMSREPFAEVRSHRGGVRFAAMAEQQWMGPLPTPDTEEWMGVEVKSYA